MKLLTFEEFEGITSQDPYYNNRWDYFSEVVKILGGCEFDSCLELGPKRQPLVVEADVMDCRPHIPGIKYLHDATHVPWPVGDKQYDMFVALQVWEHLGAKGEDGPKVQAFNEVRRIAKQAVLSFPLMWRCRQRGHCKNVHCEIPESTIYKWAHHLQPKTVIKVKETGGMLHTRMICHYEF